MPPTANNTTPTLIPVGPVGQVASIEAVRKTQTGELVIALCGPMGSPVHIVAEKLETLLRNQFHYECVVIKLSKFIEDKRGAVAAGVTRFERKKELIEKGDQLRFDHGPGVLAELAIGEISLARQKRKEKSLAERFEPGRVCHIIDSIKNQQELDVLRTVYRDMVYCVGVLSPLEFRQRNLQQRDQMKLPEVYELIDQDSGEELLHGQTVRQTFPQADFFLRVDSLNDRWIESRIRRFLDIVLNADVVTPTPEERAMFFAASAATNSACLSRQVGAAVTDANGEVLAVGWNDVPKAGGDLYCCGRDAEGDRRCANLEGGVCFNDRRKGQMTEDIVDSLIKENVVAGDNRRRAVDVIGKSKIRDLIEFSRAVHAEMHAIITGSQKSGDRMVGGKLFCTTYPCHSCARHIIAAGIMEVYYIEPYRKSLATTLHSDDITEVEAETKKVRLLPFDGVAPSRYMELFSMGEDSRKKNGKKAVVNPKEAQQKSVVSLEALPALEGAVVKILVERRLIEVHEKPKEASVKSEAARV